MQKTLLSFILFALCFQRIDCEESVIRIGMELSNPPFERLNTENKPSGISVDIAKELIKYLQKEEDILDIPFIGLIPSLKSQKIDIIISSMTPTEQRSKVIAFSDPYLSIGLCTLMNKKIQANTSAELNDPKYVIVVKTGTTGQQCAKQYFPKAEILSLQQESSCIMEVLQGRAAAFLYDQLSIYAHWKKHPRLTKVDLHPITIESWAIGLRKEDLLLKKKINTFLKEFIPSSYFKNLKKKYLSQQMTDFAKLGVPLIFSPNGSDE